jgi:hypothetical protein
MINPMIELKQKFSLKNGNKITKKNWQKVVAVGTRPCTNVGGYPVIEAAKLNGGYFERWKLVYEPAHELEDPKKNPPGYIFREINHGCGITGRHKTPKQAIWSALSFDYIKIFIED